MTTFTIEERITAAIALITSNDELMNYIDNLSGLMFEITSKVNDEKHADGVREMWFHVCSDAIFSEYMDNVNDSEHILRACAQILARKLADTFNEI